MARVETLTVGRRLLPINQIVLIEPFDPASSQNVQSAKPFKSRIVLVGRQSVLSESEPSELATQLGFRTLADDAIALSPTVHFSVEIFEPTEEFQPRKPYRARLSWRDSARATQSRLLLTEPEAVLALVAGHQSASRVALASKTTSQRQRQRKRADHTSLGPL